MASNLVGQVVGAGLARRLARGLALFMGGALLIAGCALDTEGAGPEGDADDPNQSIDTAAQGLTDFYTVYHHGGNAWEQTYQILLGGDCKPGHERYYYSVWNTGHGSCRGLRWESTDPRDCRVRVEIKDSAGWFYGDCHVRAESRTPDSCLGRCGRQTPDGCWCDSACSLHGDCCTDKRLMCGG